MAIDPINDADSDIFDLRADVFAILNEAPFRTSLIGIDRRAVKVILTS